MATYATFSAPFLPSILSPNTKILRPRIFFRVEITNIDNQYDLYSRKCADGLSILEVADFTVSYAQVNGIRSLHIIIAIASEEGLLIFSWTSPMNFRITF